MAWSTKCTVRTFLYISNKKEATEEIQKYLNLYKNIHDDIENLKDDNDEEIINNAYERIQNLYEEISSMVKRAEVGKKTTSSSTVHYLHRDIIARKPQIINQLEKVALSISRQLIRGLTNKLDSVLKTSEESG
ncbi:hypothetical protein NPIL_608501 [Nephila pilipes]|uniref:Uncharacterized protein n=1 Tax=Nephila pilipes TaxID=299642 RepID=A0A8X6J089_NEPPI|nr:hypothetical protein NPIL_608501 [Nephila pilipes]